MPATLPGVELLSRAPSHSLVAWSSVIALRWHDVATVEIFDRSALLTRGYMARVQGKFALLTIVDANVPPPSDAVRKRGTQDIDAHKGKLYASGLVVLATGFSGAALRAAVSTMLMFVQPGYPSKIHGSEAECAAWLAPLVRASSPRYRESVTNAAMLQFLEATRLDAAP